MATPPKVSLSIGGQSHAGWEHYEIDSDLLTPADAWQVSLGPGASVIPAGLAKGAPVEVTVDNETVLMGVIDEIIHGVGRDGHSLSLSGRDGAAVLVDCSAPIFVARQVSLEDIVAKVVRPLGIGKIRIDADSVKVREKVNVDPGDSAWDVLANAAEANGLWPWFEPDGTLVVGGPDYSTPTVGTLVMRRSGKGNNVLWLEKHDSIADQFSEVTVLGQAHGTARELGKNAIMASATDASLPLYRPRIVVDSEADNAGIALDRARKLLADGRLRGMTLTALVPGHRFDGTLWRPGQRVEVVSEPHDISGVYFLIARKFIGGREERPLTELTLKEDGVWVLDAHPHDQVHRKARTKGGQVLELIDVTTP